MEYKTNFDSNLFRFIVAYLNIITNNKLLLFYACFMIYNIIKQRYIFKRYMRTVCGFIYFFQRDSYNFKIKLYNFQCSEERTFVIIRADISYMRLSLKCISIN